MLRAVRRRTAGGHRQLHRARHHRCHPRAQAADRRRQTVRVHPLGGRVGEFHENIRLIAPDQETVVRKCETKFVLRDPAHCATNVAVFAGTQFEAPGVYTIEVVVEEVMKLRYPIPVVIVEPPSGAKKPVEEDPHAPKESI